MKNDIFEKPTVFTNAEFITSYSVINDITNLKKVVIRTAEAVRLVTLTDKRGAQYTEASNLREPFDFTTHVFYLGEDTLSSDIILNFRNIFRSKRFPEAETYSQVTISADRLRRVSREELIGKYDNGISIISEEENILAEGVSYKRLNCKTKVGAPVVAFTFIAQKGSCSLDVGTSENQYQPDTAIASVEDQALASIKAGKNVIGATNADFYDFHGNNAPSGLCVKDGVTIANPDSDRNFLGFTFDGEAIIGNLAETPEIRGLLRSAVGGREIFLRGGDIWDFSPEEPFAYTSHPRTAVGITADGDMIILVVDGRLPEYSNGATVVDLARLMQKLGAQTAINLDGGGSSTFLLRSGDEFTILNKPVDLVRPNEVLIRKIYNSLLLVID